MFHETCQLPIFGFFVDSCEVIEEQNGRNIIAACLKLRYPIPAQMEYNRMNSTVQGLRNETSSLAELACHALLAHSTTQECFTVTSTIMCTTTRTKIMSSGILRGHAKEKEGF